MGDCAISGGERRLDTPVPVRFVHRDRFGADEAIASDDFDALLAERRDILRSFAETGDLCWTVQTWCRLRDMGFGGVEIATEPAEGRINIARSKMLSRRGADPAMFQVSIQSDSSRLLWAHFHIQQNSDLLCEDGAFQYLWPQAGIIPRDTAREGAKRVGFIGKLDGNLAGAADQWSQTMEARGLEFVVREPERWNDFSDIDIAIGLRSFGHSRHSRKSANKLINSWIAGVPFVGGNDSAFSQVGTPGMDHLLAHNLEEAASQVERLRSDPDLYRDIVEAGRRKARAFSHERLAMQWVALLEGPVSARYRQWEAHLPRERRRVRMLGVAQRLLDAGRAFARKMLGRNSDT